MTLSEARYDMGTVAALAKLHVTDGAPRPRKEL